ncbi:membrane hypothetical protein [Burkholderiales bacterium 8X]|nr:membrane hypothetical protein [Burkholderiales bacterium 8X]
MPMPGEEMKFLLVVGLGSIALFAFVAIAISFATRRPLQAVALGTLTLFVIIEGLLVWASHPVEELQRWHVFAMSLAGGLAVGGVKMLLSKRLQTKAAASDSPDHPRT